MRLKGLWTCPSTEQAGLTPGCQWHYLLVFDEKDEGTGIASEAVKVEIRLPQVP